MRYRTLGRTAIEVSEIGFGAWGIGGGWGRRDDDAAVEAICRALDLGVNFIDTAMVYGEGHSESLVGQAVRGRRDRVRIATKIAPKTYRWPTLPRERASHTYPADWIIDCTEKSLRRLGIDRLDLQQFHSWTPEYLQQKEDWLPAVEKLKQQGKIRAWGVSANDWDPYNTVSLVESGLCDCVQVIYNIFEQRPAEKLFPAARKNQVGIIVRVPFEEGLLTGQFRPGHAFDPDDWRSEWLTEDRLVEAAGRVEALRPLLCEEAPDLPTLALKFCLAHPAVSTVIPGMRSIAHVEANVRASGPPLSDSTLAALREHAFVHGWAYPWAQK